MGRRARITACVWRKRQSRPVAALRWGSLLSAVALIVVVTPQTTSAALSSTDSCPNAAVRQQQDSAYLPDCRAYELVSPPDKGGFDVANVSAFTADGARLAFTMSGAVSGASSGAVSNSYEAERAASGWDTTFVGPPGSQEPTGAILADFSPDLAIAVSPFLSPVDPVKEDLYLRSPAGSFVEIGPTQSIAEPGLSSAPIYVGGSSDLSRVVFSSTNDFFPGDTTSPGSSSLYEYFGTGNSVPQLVGVDNSGNLLSECGTNLGGGARGSEFHAVASDGSTIFFSPVTGVSTGCPALAQVYARIDGGEADAHTVAISEPSLSDCGACDTSAPASATYQGASADGSKAFFTTTQPLLDGATGQNIYEYDFENPAGQKLLLVSGGDSTVTDPTAGVLGVTRISDDGSHVYFVATGVLTTTPNSQGSEATAGADNLYVYERDATFPGGRTVFIGDLAAADSALWGPDSGRPAEATPDGRFLVFTTSAQLTPDDTDTAQDVYEYDAVKNTLTRVSIGHDGDDQNGNDSAFSATIAAVNAGTQSGAEADFSVSPHAGRSVSDDGQYVFFTTAEALESIDNNGEPDVYEYHDGEVDLISDGQDPGNAAHPGSTFVGSTPSGQDVFFLTRDSLVSEDTDGGNTDIYDARIDGGFQTPTSAPACVGADCQGPPSPPPSPPSPATTQTGAGGNVITNAKPAAKFSLASISAAERRKLARTGKLVLSVKVSRAGKLTAKATARIDGRSRTVAKATATATSAGTRRLTLRLALAARNALAAGRAMRVTVAVRFSGSTASHTAMLNLRGVTPKRKPHHAKKAARRAGVGR